MKTRRFFNFFFGYLTVCADGPFTERLINIYMHRGFPIWDIRRCGSNRITFKTDIPSFKQIRLPARRTRSHIKILKRHGLPFILKRFRHRHLTIFGVLVLVIMLYYASTHIMGITVFGNQQIDTQTIINALGECGLRLGAETSSINHNSIRNKMMTKLDKLAWIGINANGSRVYIEIVERLEKEKGIEKDDISCNLVAKKDGIIEELNVRDGQTVVKLGSGVRKGDVLVSGIMDSSIDGFRYVKARGEVYAKTSYKLTRTFPLNYIEKTPTGNKKTKYTLSLLNLNIPLYFKDKAPYSEYTYENKTNEYRIPIDILPSLFINKQIYTEEVSCSKTRTPTEALESGLSVLSEELKGQIPNDTEILEQNESHTLNEHGELEITVELLCRENIAEQSVIEKTLPEDR